MAYPVVNPYSQIVQRTLEHTGTKNPKKILAHFDVDEKEEAKQPEKEKEKEKEIEKVAKSEPAPSKFDIPAFPDLSPKKTKVDADIGIDSMERVPFPPVPFNPIKSKPEVKKKEVINLPKIQTMTMTEKILKKPGKKKPIVVQKQATVTPAPKATLTPSPKPTIKPTASPTATPSPKPTPVPMPVAAPTPRKTTREDYANLASGKVEDPYHGWGLITESAKDAAALMGLRGLYKGGKSLLEKLGKKVAPTVFEETAGPAVDIGGKAASSTKPSIPTPPKPTTPNIPSPPKPAAPQIPLSEKLKLAKSNLGKAAKSGNKEAFKAAREELIKITQQMGGT